MSEENLPTSIEDALAQAEVVHQRQVERSRLPRQAKPGVSDEKGITDEGGEKDGSQVAR